MVLAGALVAFPLAAAGVGGLVHVHSGQPVVLLEPASFHRVTAGPGGTTAYLMAARSVDLDPHTVDETEGW